MMPIHKIQVSEFECVHCGYKWINRVNGKDRPIPKNCAKCKRFHWNGKGEGSGYNPITPRERGMRVKLYKYEGYPVDRQYQPNELCKKFLNLNPRPTKRELYNALYPLGWDPLSKKYLFLVRDPEKQGFLKRDTSLLIRDPNTGDWARHAETGKLKFKYDEDPNFKSDFDKLLDEQIQKRKQCMKQVIESRGEQVPKEKTFNELLDESKQKILEAGNILDKENVIPKNKICEKLIQDFGGLAGRMIDIESLCPPEWKTNSTKNTGVKPLKKAK